jgi:hypothetical protein
MDLAIRGAIEDGLGNLEVHAPFVWQRRGQVLTANVALRNTLGCRLTMVIRVDALRPHRPVLLVRDHGAHPNGALRLCVRGRHVNRRSDRRSWLPGTHLHQWTPEFGDSHAVDPFPPWPPEQWREEAKSATEAELLKIVNAFCQMLHIAFEAATMWVAPNLAPQPIVLPDGDEIP